MRSTVIFTTLWLAQLILVGCASTGRVHDASPITAQKPFDLDLIWVETSSAVPELEPEKRMLNDAVVSGLRETRLFQSVSGDKVELGTGSGITLEAQITEIRKISNSKRLWAGAMAGRAHVRVHVRISDFNSGQSLETFEADGESSTGSALAGTTDEAIERAAAEVVGEVVKMNAQTAE